MAARVFAGQGLGPAAAAGQSLGPAGLTAALALAAGQPPAALRRAQVATGDLGEVALSVLPARPATLTLAEVPARLARLAAQEGSQAKRGAMAALLGEATPLEARLIIKQVGGELRLGMGEGSIEDAIARAFVAPLEEVRRAHMVSGDLGHVARLARHGRLAEATLQLFRPVGAMLASPLAQAMTVPDDGVARVVEDKFDGIRVQVHIGPEPAAAGAPWPGAPCGGARVALFSRGRDDITGSFPELAAALAAAAGSGAAGAASPARLVLDGEIVALEPDSARVAPFARLQRRLGVTSPSARLQAEVPVACVAFDLLVVGGALALDWPLTRRRVALEGALGAAGEGPVRLGEQAVWSPASALPAAFAAARARGNEGLMLKAQSSPYTPGRRGQAWLKVKAPHGCLDVVVTRAEVGQGRRRAWLSDVTFAVRTSAQDPTLQEVGRAYGGLTDAELGELTTLFRQFTLEVREEGRLHLLAPRVVLEVLCDRVQRSRRYLCGYSLRFPRIARWRRDLTPDDASTLDDVAALCAP